MRRLALIGLLALCGCYVPPEGGDPPSPAPASLSGAAEKSGRDYLTGLAEAWDTAAERVESGEFKSMAQVYDFVKAESQAAREKGMAVYEEALNKKLPPDKEYKAKDAAKAFREVAEGFRKAAK